MRRPRQIHLVTDAGVPYAIFDDLSEAHEYAEVVHGASAYVHTIQHWPAGVWRHGVEIASPSWDSASHYTAEPVPAHPSPVVQAAHRQHMRANWRCRGAGVTTINDPRAHGRFACDRCRDRIL